MLKCSRARIAPIGTFLLALLVTLGCSKETDQVYRFSPGAGRGGNRTVTYSPAPGSLPPRTSPPSVIDPSRRIPVTPRYGGIGSLPVETQIKNVEPTDRLIGAPHLKLGAVGSRKANIICLQVDGHLTVDGSGRVTNGNVTFGDQLCPTTGAMATVKYTFTASPVTATPSRPNVSRVTIWAINFGGRRIGTLEQIPRAVNNSGTFSVSSRYALTELCNGTFEAACDAVLR